MQEENSRNKNVSDALEKLSGHAGNCARPQEGQRIKNGTHLMVQQRLRYRKRGEVLRPGARKETIL